VNKTKNKDKAKVELLKELEILREERKKGVFKDITERKQAEQALIESEEKYRTVFENTGAATIIIEEDTPGERLEKKLQQNMNFV
jgi:PAS domain-containing protein